MKEQKRVRRKARALHAPMLSALNNKETVKDGESWRRNKEREREGEERKKLEKTWIIII